MDTPIKRTGALLTAGGLALLIVGVVAVARSVYEHPPPRPEFIAQWEAEQVATDRAEIREALRRAQAGETPPAADPNQWNMVAGPPIDRNARWTPATVTAAIAADLAHAATELDDQRWARAFVYCGARATLLGLFLWLVYGATVGRLWRWIRFGTTELPPARRAPSKPAPIELMGGALENLTPEEWKAAMAARDAQEERGSQHAMAQARKRREGR